MSIAEAGRHPHAEPGAGRVPPISGRIFTLCLVTRFGDVPVLRQNTQAKVSRDPASMAWELVEEDTRRGFEAS